MNKINQVLKPRKSPVQSRSIATINTIHEATLQVLIKDGLLRCNTTRVAERAGISVGSLYQYYPNRDALLSAILEKHIDEIISTIDAICIDYKHNHLNVMIAALIHGLLKAKLKNSQKSKALYAIAAERGGEELSKKMSNRMIIAISSLLESAPDASFEDNSTVAEIILGTIIGSLRRVLEGQVSEKVEQQMEHHLTVMVIAYLQEVNIIQNK